jgi:hypothetical protein
VSAARQVLGGSSSINGLVHIRGQREDYDGWGVSGWGFDDLLPYFKKSEDYAHGASEWHGAGGPLAVSDLPDRHELCDAFIGSAMALGIPRNDDFNGATQEGTGYYQTTARNGRRCSAAVGYLVRRSGVPICASRSIATRVLFEARRATGVVYEAGGAKHEARAAREVILAAGTINTPQLLQLSGVGPRALLERHGIPLVHDAPAVGEDLQDHFYCRTFWRCKIEVGSLELRRACWVCGATGKIGLRKKYFAARRGPLTVSAGPRPCARGRKSGVRMRSSTSSSSSTARRGGCCIRLPVSRSKSRRPIEIARLASIASSDPGGHRPPSICYSNYLATEGSTINAAAAVTAAASSERWPLPQHGPTAAALAVGEELPGPCVQR